MSTEYGIFSDESPDHTSESAVESQMYSREEAESRLAEMRREYGAEWNEESGEWDDNCYVHECEEPDDETEEEDDEAAEDDEEG